MTLKTTIPFSGFYHSIHDSNIDDCLHQLVTDDSGDVNDRLLEALYEHNAIEWSDIYDAYAKCYAENLALRFELKSLTYNDLHSPREYNFTTDRIFCKISLDEIRKIYASMSINLLRQAITEKFTSYDGFISFYPNDLDEWPLNLEEWDHNQIGTLLECWIVEQNGGEFDSNDEHETIGDPYHEPVGEIVYSALNDKGKRIVRIADYLRTRKERKWR